MAKNLKLHALILLTCLFASCGTMHRFEKTGKKHYPTINTEDIFYQSTQFDFKQLQNPLNGIAFFWPGSYLPFYMSIPIYLGVNTLFLIDVPVSLIVDTVYLPKDISDYQTQVSKIDLHRKEVAYRKSIAVPMLVKSTGWIKVPKNDTPCGYDLEVGDWVIPHGKGKVNDFIFNMGSRFVTPRDSEAKYDLYFSDSLDGIQEFTPEKGGQSTFSWPYLAPAAGYKQELSRFVYRGSSPTESYIYKTNNKKSANYIYRVRTKVDSSGKVISANYGYIHSEIECNRFENGRLRFTYHFNPDKHSRSLEFNGVNLFKDRDFQGREK